MKKLIIVLLILVWGKVSGQVVNMTEWNLDTFAKNCMQELKIDSAKVYIIPFSGKIYGTYEAFAIKNNGIYVVYLSGTLGYEASLKALSHELAHVRQYYRNEITIKSKQMITFKNVNYKVSEDSHYTDPQEVEAREIGVMLFEKNKPRLMY